nr:hypothetical protein [Tanacetum cinerariifolium]
MGLESYLRKTRQSKKYLDELKRLSNLEYRDEIKIAELKENFNVTPSLSIEEPDHSLSMGDEHLDTISATESDEVIEFSVENLIPIPSESEGIPDHMCDVPSHDNSPPLDVSKDQFEDFSDSNDEFSSPDDDSFSIDNIDYVEASPPDFELVISKVMEIVIPKVGGIDDDILLTIKDDILRENLLNVNHLFAKIEALNDNPIPFYDPIISGSPPTLTPSGERGHIFLEAFLNDDHSSDFKTKSSSSSLNSLLEETNNFDNSLPEFTTFSNVLFDVEYESGSSDDHSYSDEYVLEKIVPKPLFEEEIISIKIDLHPDNAKFDLLEPLRTHDSSPLISSKIDSLLDEFPVNSLFSNRFHQELMKLIVILRETFVLSRNYYTITLLLDSDSLMEEMDLSCTPDYPMPPGIEDDDYDSERDILILKDLPSNDTLSIPEKESFHFDIPSFSRPPAKPPDGNTRILNIKMMGDISDQQAFMHKLMITLASHQEKSSDLLSHRGLKAFQPFATYPMMIHGQNNPILDVLLFHFYPP